MTISGMAFVPIKQAYQMMGNNTELILMSDGRVGVYAWGISCMALFIGFMAFLYTMRRR